MLMVTKSSKEIMLEEMNEAYNEGKSYIIKLRKSDEDLTISVEIPNNEIIEEIKYYDEAYNDDLQFIENKEDYILSFYKK